MEGLLADGFGVSFNPARDYRHPVGGVSRDQRGGLQHVALYVRRAGARIRWSDVAGGCQLASDATQQGGDVDCVPSFIARPVWHVFDW